MNLQEIVFPVFRLSENEPAQQDGVSFYLSHKETSDGEQIVKIRIIDDTTIVGANLGLRRARLAADNVDLFRISKAIFFLGDLVKLAKAHTWFIDNTGKIFNYKKHRRAKLSFHKITNVIRIPSGGALIEVDSISSRFKCLFPPDVETRYAGILTIGMMHILYGFYPDKHQDTFRMI